MERLIFWIVNQHACLVAWVVSDCFVTPWIVARQAPLPMQSSRQEYWSGLPCSPLGNRPDPRVESTSSVSSVSQADSLPLNHQGRPSSNIKEYKEVNMGLP